MVGLIIETCMTLKQITQRTGADNFNLFACILPADSVVFQDSGHVY